MDEKIGSKLIGELNFYELIYCLVVGQSLVCCCHIGNAGKHFNIFADPELR